MTLPLYQVEKQLIESTEAKVIVLHCLRSGEEYRFVDEPIEGDIVTFGTVPFVQRFLGCPIQPDYVPEFLRTWVSRRVWISKNLPENAWVKPADLYKRFIACHSSQCKDVGPYWCSEVVEFKNEWRVYVVDGKVQCSFAYGYCQEELEPPQLDIDLPFGYCGALDFGMVDGQIELVEAHHPFSIGWYGGLNDFSYIHFLKRSHRYLQRTIQPTIQPTAL